MRGVRSSLLVLVVAVGLAAPACTQREATSFSGARDDFVKSCTEGTGNASDCTCAYDKIQKAMTFDEFKKLDARLQEHPDASEVPDEVLGFIGDCTAARTSGVTTSTTQG